MAAEAAAVVVLPTPPDPHTITISLAAKRASRVSGRTTPPASGPARGISSPAPRRGRRRADGWRAARGCGRTGTGRTAAGRPGRRPFAERSRCSVRERRMLTVSRAASMIGPVGPPRAAVRRASAAGVARRSNTCSSPRPNSSGRTRLTTTAARSTLVSVAQPGDQLERLADRHLGRRGHHHQPGRRRIVEDLEHPPRLLADQADLHQLVDGLRARPAGRRCARCGRASTMTTS